MSTFFVSFQVGVVNPDEPNIMKNSQVVGCANAQLSSFIQEQDYDSLAIDFMHNLESRIEERLKAQLDEDGSTLDPGYEVRVRVLNIFKLPTLEEVG